ncbi:MAG TPA: imidazole glycerol phosphate synthase subunit HisH [bacterium]|nr:imidazole glycerol phosphate synthase subunit HisH [bacterium]HQL61783.1 imidazole glycerol phosphate synthase subunit HisH [bacterium]
MIGIVDYGMGNLRSVESAFEAIDQKTTVIRDPRELAEVQAIILPGVGAFGDGMRNLRESGFVEILNEEVLEKEKPYLGICLGLQFLAEKSLEQGEHDGLGWITGTVRRIDPESAQYRVPHIGWNDLRIEIEEPIFKNLEDGPIFYFVHSYYMDVSPEDSSVIAATCWHGQKIVAAVQRGNIYGVQFHPEKSQRSGLCLLRNFVDQALKD